MLHQHQARKKPTIKISPNSKVEFQRAINDTPLFFKEKILWLQEKWGGLSKNFGDSHELRNISSCVFDTITPLNAAIIVDNLAYFKEKYIQDTEKTYKLFQIACLCGSEGIANFLYEKLETKPEPSTLLQLVSASQNQEWAKKIAKEIKTIPDEVYLFCTEKKVRDAIKNASSEAPTKNRQ